MDDDTRKISLSPAREYRDALRQVGAWLDTRRREGVGAECCDDVLELVRSYLHSVAPVDTFDEVAP